MGAPYSVHPNWQIVSGGFRALPSLLTSEFYL
uniref:Uncharacterized protein n=1 Tax=Arundo donax TaxID=35708 RepID=A0A0A9AH60_ARUDO